MRRWLGIVALVLLVAGAGMGVWCWRNWDRLRLEWASARVVRAESYDAARQEIAWFESEPNRAEKLRGLVELWGTGGEEFDLYLARYVAEAATPELRQRFSLELGWRRELLPRWAHFWAWRAKLDPNDEVRAVVEHFDLLDSADPPEPITWRDVLTLQAVFQLTGDAGSAHRLKPSNWQARYRRWQSDRPKSLPHVERPEAPFPDWQAEVPGNG